MLAQSASVELSHLSHVPPGAGVSAMPPSSSPSSPPSSPPPPPPPWHPLPTQLFWLEPPSESDPHPSPIHGMLMLRGGATPGGVSQLIRHGFPQPPPVHVGFGLPDTAGIVVLVTDGGGGLSVILPPWFLWLCQSHRHQSWFQSCLRWWKSL